MINNIFKRQYTFDEIYLVCFPIAVLLRSVALNLYIILGAIFFIYKIFKNKIKIENKILFYPLITFILYLVVISFNAENAFIAFKSSISQFRFVFFAFFIASLDLEKINFKKIIIFYTLIVNFISLDTIHQYHFGYDFFGIEADVNTSFRLGGPFGTELIVGTFIAIMSIPIVSYLMYNIKKIKNFEKSYLFTTTLLSFLTVILSGERIALLIIIFTTFLIALKTIDLRKIIVIFIIFTVSLFGAYKNIKSINYKFNEFFSLIKLMNKSPHIRLFSSAVIVGSKNLFIGTGLKNYRINCDNLITENYKDKFTNETILCSTHPHNIYLEIFAECGLVGFLLFLLIIFVNVKYFWHRSKNISDNLKYIFYSALVILIAYIWPIRSSGSFFSTFSASFFWFFYGVMLLSAQSKTLNFSSNQSN